MEERPKCCARIPKDGQFFKFRDKDGNVVRKRCFMEFRCDYYAFQDGLCRRHLEKRLRGEGSYDHRHPMKNWAGVIGVTWPDEHAPFYGSPEYMKIVSQGYRLSADEEELCRKARMLAMGLAEDACEEKNGAQTEKSKRAECSKSERQDKALHPDPVLASASNEMARPKKKPSQEPPSDTRPVTELLKEPALFVTSRTPYKTKEVECIERAELEEYVRTKLEENPELKKLFTM